MGYGIVFLQNFSLAYFLSVEFFGEITLIISLFSTLYVLFTFGLNAVVQRFYFDKVLGADKRILLSHIATLWLFLGGVLCIVLMMAGYYAFTVHNIIPIDYFREFLPVLFGAFLFSFSEIFPNFYIMREKPVHYALWLTSSRATIFVLIHVAVLSFGESSFHISIMLMASGFLLAGTGVVLFKIFPIANLHKAYLKEILIYSFPLMIYALGGIGYSHGYRVIISGWLSYADLGIFSLTNQIALVYYLTASSCVTAFYPKAYKALEESQGHPRALGFYLRILLYLGVALMILIGPLGYVFLQYFKGGEFAKGLEIFPVLLVSQFVFFVYSYNYILCTFYKKTKVITYSMLAGVLTSLSLAYVLLREFSLWGAALPIAFGVSVQFIVSFILINRVARNTSANLAPEEAN